MLHLLLEHPRLAPDSKQLTIPHFGQCLEVLGLPSVDLEEFLVLTVVGEREGLDQLCDWSVSSFKS